jgi:NAD(P)H dehydrogenase (quinone)
MPKVLIVYYSRTGNTRKMAGHVADGVKQEQVKVAVRDVRKVVLTDLLKADGIIIGSPTYYGSAAAPIRHLIDRTVKYHGRLEGKVGGAFTSSGGIAGGNETTLLSTLTALLVHGMIIQGASADDHYGAVAIGAPDKAAAKRCVALGRRVARLVKRLAVSG